MCGIAGSIDLAGGPVDRAMLARACGSMRHRGPDDAGVWTDEHEACSVGLASTRLAILDPTPAGYQPMLRAGGRHVEVFNGLIYNYRELAADLRAEGEDLAGRCDTEVVLAACARWGDDAPRRFRGMFAFAYYDRVERRGFLARDPMGIKPLIYARDGLCLLFASEIRTLLGMGEWPTDINQAALIHYVSMGYAAHPDTIYASAHRLPPGTVLPFSAGGIGEPVPYYQPSPRADAGGFDRAEACRMLRRAIRDSVARRRVADVPLGAFLSGGLDSSIVVAHLADLTPQPVKTFSIGWSDQRAYDETRYARGVARRFGTDHHELRCGYDDVLALLPRMLDHLGEPFFDSSILPTAIVSELARRHVHVSLSGDGADELFGGYWRYLAQGAFDRYRRVPAVLRRALIEPFFRRAAGSKSSAWQDRVRQFQKLIRADSDDPLERHVAWARLITPATRDILRVELTDTVVDRLRAETADLDAGDALNRILSFDLRYGLPNDMLYKVDLASMYHSLEVRVPFLDTEVVELVTGWPSSWKIDRAGTKSILKDAYRGLVPDDVLDRPKKGFEVPIGEFLRRELREMFMDTVTRETVESFGILRYDAVRRAYDAHLARREEHADLLFAMLSLCWWRRRACR